MSYQTKPNKKPMNYLHSRRPRALPAASLLAAFSLIGTLHVNANHLATGADLALAIENSASHKDAERYAGKLARLKQARRP